MESGHEQSHPPADATPSNNPTASTEDSPSSSVVPPRPNPYNPPLDTDLPPPTQTRPRNRDSISSPNTSEFGGLSPGATDRVFPIRSVIQLDPTATPAPRIQDQGSYFGNVTRGSDGRRTSASTESSARGSERQYVPGGSRSARHPADEATSRGGNSRANPPRLPPQVFTEIIGNRGDEDMGSVRAVSRGGSSGKSIISEQDMGGHMTTRFKHVVTDGGHAIITGRGGDILQRCEDEPIHIPGAIQGFGLLIALQESDGKFLVRIVSENSKKIIGFTPKQLFELDSFTDILSEEQADNLLDHIDFIREEDADVATNGPEVFTMSIRSSRKKATKLWCAVHINDTNPNLIICEFELEDDIDNPLVPPNDMTPDIPEDTLSANPTAEEYAESTENISRPLRVLRSARKRRGEAAAMEVFNIMSQVQEQLAAAPSLDRFLKVLVGVVKELTGFHRVMVYQFDQQWNGKVVTELVDPRATKDLYHGLHFPASDIPKQARDLYKINRVRMLYDRDQETARLVCRTLQDLETPLDLTYSYLRAMSPIHLKYLTNMAVRSSMSISINAFNELWGLISCHSYGPRGMRVAFPIRKMCRLVGDTASRNIERLSYASRLQARKLINTASSEHNPSGYIIASSEDLLKLFNADCGLLSIREETKILGRLEQSQEALAMLEYLRLRKLTSVTASLDITQDFPDLKYPPGFSVLAGLLFVPLSVGGNDFIVFFRKGQHKEVRWAGNPYEKVVKQGTQAYLEPRKSFKLWSETIVGRCREWTEEEIETAAVLCLVYGKFIEVWRQKEAALQNSELTRLLLANSAHEVRTPLNAIINYLEIALEGSLDQETRDNLAKSHSASKSLIYVINDLLDLTKTEEGVELIKGESFNLRATLTEATDPFNGDAKRKGISYDVLQYPGLPKNVVGDQRKVRQAISNIIANAIQNTTEGSVKVEMYVVDQAERRVDVEVVVEDTGAGMTDQKVESLFRDLEQVQPELLDPFSTIDSTNEPSKQLPPSDGVKRILGLGLAVVARIIRNMNGQMRLKSEEGKGSRFVLQFPFDLPDGEEQSQALPMMSPGAESAKEEVTLIKKDTTRKSSLSDTSLEKRKSSDSLHSMNSRNSMKSVGSGQSGRSDVDRLIEAIQEPYMIEGKRPARPSRKSWDSQARPGLEHRHSYAGPDPGSPSRRRAKSIEHGVTITPEHLRSMDSTTPGEEGLQYSNMPVRAIKVPDEDGDLSSPVVSVQARSISPGAIIGEIQDTELPEKKEEQPQKTTKTFDANAMHVLVAEDDPINSRIVKKRMESRGHKVHLTTNGEECASAYCERSEAYDLVLMDMQMPIVDGLTSTKMIRAHEKKSHPPSTLPSSSSSSPQQAKNTKLSERAALNGRIPIIAVSASLVERERQTYVDAGFDAWILKPISFDRLQTLLTGIVDPATRKECLYKPGLWEQGGWFDNAPLAKADKTVQVEEEKRGDAVGVVDNKSIAAGAMLKSASAPATILASGVSEDNRTVSSITDQLTTATPEPIRESTLGEPPPPPPS